MAKKNKKYKDPPRYQVIVDYEQEFLNHFQKDVAKMSGKLIVTMTKFIKANSKDEIRRTKT